MGIDFFIKVLSLLSEKQTAEGLVPLSSRATKFPWGCDFGKFGVAVYDMYECQMTQNKGSDVFWKVTSGETPTNYTGPPAANLKEHGMYQ